MSGNYVINIGRQLGSGGKEIGEKLAARLGIKVAVPCLRVQRPF